MQDPMNPQSTRRAGESARRSDSPDGHLSDWQRHTAWIGPVPSNPDPFDDPRILRKSEKSGPMMSGTARVISGKIRTI